MNHASPDWQRYSCGSRHGTPDAPDSMKRRKLMSAHLGHHGLASVGFALVVAACAHESEVGPGVTTTSAVVLSNQEAVHQVAQARCRRLDECNRLGNGQIYVDRAQCMVAYRDVGADVPVVRSCVEGVDKKRLDVCLAALADQRCDADLGPVPAIQGCRAYCARVDYGP
jgi:hypothetical protein